MKKVFILLLFVSALVACSKVEVISLVQDNKTMITYQTAPITKGHDKFDNTYVFQSAAYYLAPSDAVGGWTKNATKGQLYIPAGTVKYSDTWKMATPYYWPKDGTLTFYSWSLNKQDLNFNSPIPTVKIDKEKGVTIEGYDITVQKNLDFIVAIPAENKTENIKTYYEMGVPTLFKHQLSQLTITAKTDTDYTASKTFEIQSIKILNVAKTGNFQEAKNDPSTGWEVINQWTTTGTYNATYSDSPIKVNATETTIAGIQTIYLPETFGDDEVVEISYTITDVATNIVETITTRVSLKTITKTTSTGGAFKNGTKYTFNLIFKLNEIYWDPAVEDWIDSDHPIYV